MEIPETGVRYRNVNEYLKTLASGAGSERTVDVVSLNININELLVGAQPRLIDEWQDVPKFWVRRVRRVSRPSVPVSMARPVLSLSSSKAIKAARETEMGSLASGRGAWL